MDQPVIIQTTGWGLWLAIATIFLFGALCEWTISHITPGTGPFALRTYHAWHQVKRFVRFVFDLPVFALVALVHRIPEPRGLPPGITMTGHVKMVGYTILVDNRGNTEQPIILIKGSHSDLKHLHFRVLDTPRAMIEIQDASASGFVTVKDTTTKGSLRT